MTLKQLAERANSLVAEVGSEKAATLRVAIPTGQGGSTVNADAVYPGLSFIDGCIHLQEGGEHGFPECVLIQ